MGIWGISFLVLLIEILAFTTINYVSAVSKTYIEIICKVYFVLLLWQTILALRYILVDMLNRRISGTVVNRVMLTYGITASIIICLLPIGIKGNAVIGPGLTCTYLLCGLVLLVLDFVIVVYKDRLNKGRREGIFIWMVIWCVAVVVQIIYDNVVVVSIASVIGVLVIFLRLENPETNLDRETGLFNLNAFSQYMRQLQGNKKDVSLVLIAYESNRNGNMSYEMEKMVTHQIVDFLSGLDNVVIFRNSTNEFVLLFETQSEATDNLEIIKERFKKPWGLDQLRMITLEWYYIETTDNIESPGDILPIFQYARQNKSSLSTDGGVIISSENINMMYEERHMENIIVEALMENRVEVFYQPIFSVKDKKFNCAEALVRIRDENGQIVPPGKFIGIAEKKGLIIRLGECVFEQVCKFLVEENPVQYGVEYIEVNLSVLQCGYEQLSDDFINIMNKYKVDPSMIVLEITESASIKEKNILLKNMEKLRSVGVRFALDDFGTGQSNLNYIVEMPVDVVKFDSTMTNAYFENGTAKYVMDAAMQMIQGMDLEIVSEGIEESEQYKTMKELGIDYIQGFYFSRPVDSDEFIRFMKEKFDEE